MCIIKTEKGGGILNVLGKCRGASGDNILELINTKHTLTHLSQTTQWGCLLLFFSLIIYLRYHILHTSCLYLLFWRLEIKVVSCYLYVTSWLYDYVSGMGFGKSLKYGRLRCKTLFKKV